MFQKRMTWSTGITDFVNWCGVNHQKDKRVSDRLRESTNTWVFTSTINWTGPPKTNVLYKKGQSHLHLLRRLRPFGLYRTQLRTFYDTMVASVILYAVVCGGCGGMERHRKRLNKLVRRASSHPLYQTVHALCCHHSAVDCCTHSAGESATTGRFSQRL